MATKVKKPPSTPNQSSARATRFNERLKQEGGSRSVIDFNADQTQMLSELIDGGYGSSKSDVVRKAVEQAHAKRIKK